MSGTVLDIIIVDYDAGEFLRDCLASIKSHMPRYTSMGRIVVVDNASRNPSEQWIQRVDLRVTLIRNGKNMGFAAACNQGARGSDADYLLFLNPDTRLTANSLDVPACFLSAPGNRDVGIVGIQLVDDHGRISSTCRRFPRPSHIWNRALGLVRISRSWFPTGEMEDWDHGDSRQVDQVMGAFFFVRREVFEELGGFDERFFVYFEEVDFSLRAMQSGWRSVFLSDAQAFHTGSGTTEKIKAQRLFYSLRSRIQYGYKHFGLLSATLMFLVTLLVEPASRMTRAMAKSGWREVVQTAHAYLMLWGSLPKMLLNVLRSSRSVSSC